MPWAYERPYKMDITEAVRKAGLSIGDTIPISTTVVKYDGTTLDVTFPSPLIIERPANSDHDIAVVQYTLTAIPPYKVCVTSVPVSYTHLRAHETL